MQRKIIFDTVRRLLGRGFRQAEVQALDAAIDSASKEGEAPTAVSAEGIALIKRFEGCKLTAYPDPGSGGEPWTIGWGTTRIGGEPVRPGTTISQAQADDLLHADLERYAAEVSAAIGGTPTTQAQFDALVSFHYNTGAIGRATLTSCHVAGDHAGAAREFSRWIRAGGRAMAGLARRRAAEAALYESSGRLSPATQVGNRGSQHFVGTPRGVPTMRCIAAAVAAISLITGAAHAQGQGQGRGNDKPAEARQQGAGQGKADHRDHGQDDSSMAQSMRRAEQPDNNGNAAREERGGNADQGNRGEDRANERAAERASNDDRRRDNGNRAVAVDRRDSDRGDDDRRVEVVRVRDFARLEPRGLIEGCPPGLARKNPPCVPPGQARNDPFGWDRPDFWGLRLGDGRYFYDDGYLIRYAPSGGILGYIPLLGGALAVGNAWPDYYAPFAMPDYYERYYGLGPYDSYRYADDVIYRIDPETEAITSIAALLTGDEFAVGQPMPPGYDVYNVPWDYRDDYIDGPEADYRYADGHVYQVDPETRLIAAAIELLAS